MKDLRLIALSATVFFSISCTADKPEYGPTIDERLTQKVSFFVYKDSI